MKLMIQPLKKYFQFSGRARRSEFWLFQLFLIVVGIILVFFDKTVGSIDEITGNGLFSGIFVVLTLVPTISVMVRRLHDTDRSGWWLLSFIIVPIVSFVLSFVPILNLGLIGTPLLAVCVILLVFFCLNGTKGENRFGPDPKADVNESNF